MATNPAIEYAILNIAANPHPKGTYLELFRSVAMNRVNYWGAHFATISSPLETEEGYYQGRLVTWVKIDTNEPAVNLNDLDPIEFNDLDFELPQNVGFNGTAFLYSFREKDHLLFIEVKNEFGKRLSANIVQKIFKKLFSPEILGPDAPLVEVTVIPEEDALERIWRINKLKRLKIHIVRPNADDIDPAIVLEELIEQGARSQDKILVASPQDDGIKPNKKTLVQASVAVHNGYVEGSGQNEDGDKITLSTKAYPRIIKRSLGEFGGYFALVLQVAKNTIIR